MLKQPIVGSCQADGYEDGSTTTLNGTLVVVVVVIVNINITRPKLQYHVAFLCITHLQKNTHHARLLATR